MPDTAEDFLKGVQQAILYHRAGEKERANQLAQETKLRLLKKRNERAEEELKLRQKEYEIDLARFEQQANQPMVVGNTVYRPGAEGKPGTFDVAPQPKPTGSEQARTQYWKAKREAIGRKGKKELPSVQEATANRQLRIINDPNSTDEQKRDAMAIYRLIQTGKTSRRPQERTTVSPGETVIDPTTGKEIYTAPEDQLEESRIKQTETKRRLDEKKLRMMGETDTLKKQQLQAEVDELKNQLERDKNQLEREKWAWERIQNPGEYTEGEVRRAESILNMTSGRNKGKGISSSQARIIQQNISDLWYQYYELPLEQKEFKGFGGKPKKLKTNISKFIQESQGYIDTVAEYNPDMASRMANLVEERFINRKLLMDKDVLGDDYLEINKAIQSGEIPRINRWWEEGQTPQSPDSPQPSQTKTQPSRTQTQAPGTTQPGAAPNSWGGWITGEGGNGERQSTPSPPPTRSQPPPQFSADELYDADKLYDERRGARTRPAPTRRRPTPQFSSDRLYDMRQGSTTRPPTTRNKPPPQFSSDRLYDADKLYDERRGAKTRPATDDEKWRAKVKDLFIADDGGLVQGKQMEDSIKSFTDMGGEIRTMLTYLTELGVTQEEMKNNEALMTNFNRLTLPPTEGRRQETQEEPPTPTKTEGPVNIEKVQGAVNEYSSIIKQKSDKYNVDANLIKAVIFAESSGNPNAKSRVGAQGLMQLMPATAQVLGVKDPFDPDQNIEGGARYLGRMLKKFGNVKNALEAYNAGMTRVEKDDIPQETIDYANKVLRIKRQLDLRQRGTT